MARRSLQPEVAAIVEKALEIDPAVRYAKAQAFLADLKRASPGGFALDESMIGAPAPTSRERIELAPTELVTKR